MLFFVMLALAAMVLFFLCLKYLFRRPAGPKDRLHRTGKIVAVLEGPQGKRVYETHNIITNDGDIFCAQMLAGETPDNAFVNLVLGSGAAPVPAKADDYDDITPIGDTNKAPSAGYPKSDDDDADNAADAAANVTTWKYAYAKTDFSAASITEGVITIAAPEAESPVLCHFAFDEAFSKTANDTLTVFYNAEAEGV